AGACGWLLKTEALETLLDAVRAVARGEMYFSPAILPAAMQMETKGGAHSVLSPRQAQILQQVAEGKPSTHIANELGISQRTVDEHLGHVLQKLGASSRAQAVAIALRRGWIE
ncbi:MAG: response regulator transcription factor, partial [Chloroflexi bacterium]|nr:response regulator transcription factor [Chloroflexota bacterium]